MRRSPRRRYLWLLWCGTSPPENGSCARKRIEKSLSTAWQTLVCRLTVVWTRKFFFTTSDTSIWMPLRNSERLFKPNIWKYRSDVPRWCTLPTIHMIWSLHQMAIIVIIWRALHLPYSCGRRAWLCYLKVIFKTQLWSQVSLQWLIRFKIKRSLYSLYMQASFLCHCLSWSRNDVNMNFFVDNPLLIIRTNWFPWDNPLLRIVGKNWFPWQIYKSMYE